MIKSFRCKDTESIFNDKSTPKFKNIENAVRRKLEILNAAINLNELRSPPGNRLELLKGGREGQYSIRINQQWRICFVWFENNAYDV